MAEKKNPKLVTACWAGTDDGYKVGDKLKANGQPVTVTEIQGGIVHFTPAVEYDKTRSVTLEA